MGIMRRGLLNGFLLLLVMAAAGWGGGVVWKLSSCTGVSVELWLDSEADLVSGSLQDFQEECRRKPGFRAGRPSSVKRACDLRTDR